MVPSVREMRWNFRTAPPLYRGYTLQGMDALELHGRLYGANRSFGDSRRWLVLGHHGILIEGLDDELCATLERRWGGFLRRTAAGPPRATVRVFRAGPDLWLAAPQHCEVYRIEALNDPARRLVVSYHFGIGAEAGPPPSWRIGITDQPDEPLERILENALRFVAAHLAVDEGGFAMHAAGVARDGRAFLFAGPSGAGKSTAVRLAAPATGLGDDFGLVVPTERGWMAPALPFDNAERIVHRPPGGPFSVAGIWRLYQASETRVEEPRADLAVASLMGCIAFPWAMPERSERLLEHAGRYVREGRYRHLYFTRETDLWPHLI